MPKKPILRMAPTAWFAALVLAMAAGRACAQGVSADDFAKVQAELARQAKVIEAQQTEIDALRAERRGAPTSPGEAVRATLIGVPQAAPAEPAPAVAVIAAPASPVGERPAEEAPRQIAAIPPELGVLTPKGRLVIDPSVEFVRSSNNRLVFRGVEIVPGIQLGVIEASDAARDTGVATLAARYGLTNRLEVEARIPYIWRDDRITTLAQRDETISRSSELRGQDIGDIEFDARYQLNSGTRGGPIFVATSRLKPPTGVGPYNVDYDEFGVATSLATGSGFWGLEGGVTMLYPTDPAIIFAGLTYLHNFSRNIDRTIGSGDAAVHVGEVEPGDSIGASLGFGLALNPRFSISLGYSHSYIFKTTSELGATKQTTQPLQVGSLLMGWSFRLTERLTLNNSFEFGVTSDAPDVRVVFRLPYVF
ncbi:transporter [Phenylobacterium sp.]|uniref:transporter n=1 Tax=Phenylobacterium sp. TaxID=1871053 RepID=UPI0035688074